MHRLEKNCVATPLCVAGPPLDAEYGDLTSTQRAEIRAALLTVQGHRCAYCERRTGDHRKYDGHIEHFHRQTDRPDLALSWDNLYWSCNDERTCGKHKDRCIGESGDQRRFDTADVVNPGLDDPEEYLHFVSDGEVVPRNEIQGTARRRAEETIRVFQLNESAYLKRSRQDAVRPFLGAIEILLDSEPEILERYVRKELARSFDAPHSTAIKHLLASVIP